MFFKNKTKVFISTLNLSNSDDLVHISSINTHRVSALDDFTSSVQARPVTFPGLSNTIGDNINRGTHTTPGSMIGYNISIITNICLTDTGVTNNLILWDNMLTGAHSVEHAVHPTYINNLTNHAALPLVSILLLNGEYCQVFTGCIISGLGISVNLNSLLSGSWSILANNSYISANTKYTDELYHNDIAMTYTEDSPLEYIAERLTLVNINSVNVPALSIRVQLNHNVSVIPNNTINSVGIITGYQLGAFAITGDVNLYTRPGSTFDLSNVFRNNYITSAAAIAVPFIITFKGRVNSLKLTIGDVFISMPGESFSQVYNTTLAFTANNHLNNGLLLEKI